MDSITSTLQEVLDDLGRFLGETLVGESLSSRAEAQRAELLQRLGPHIRRSGVDVTSVPKMTPQHIDVRSVNGSDVEEKYEEPATVVASQSASSSSNSRKAEDSFKVNLPFNTLRNKTVKCGPLWRREKLVFLDQWRKCWTGLYGHFLLMYSSRRDVKPSVYVNVNGFVARPAPNCIKDSKKMDATFEIVCPGKRDYQFIARTAKDMHQWVAAICQVSIQYIQASISPPPHHSIPPLPHRTLDRSVLRSAKDVPAPAGSDSETYDDVSSVINSEGDREAIYVLGQPYEEEFYEDISDVCQRSSRLESKPDEVKSVEKCHPLPPQQCSPTASQDDLSDQDSAYDDAGDLNQCNGYYNMADTGVGGRDTEVQPSTCVQYTKAQLQQSVKLEVQYDDGEKEEEEEEMYDEIGVAEELPNATKPPVLQQSRFLGNRSRIQSLIKQLETSLPKGNIPICGYHPDSKISNQIQPNTSILYKSVKNSGQDRISQTTTANHNTKSKPNTSNLHKAMKNREENITLFSPSTPEPPELPPRSYIKQ